jgi:hypothetical protein
MTKISQLTNIGSALAADDEFVVRDVSDVSTPNKKVTSSGIIDYIIAQGGVSGFAQIAAGVGPLARALASSSGTTGTLVFGTASTGSLVERARIDSSGRLLVGTTTASTATSAQHARIQIAGHTGATEAPARFVLRRNETSSNISVNEQIGQIFFGEIDFCFEQCSLQFSHLFFVVYWRERVVRVDRRTGSSSPIPMVVVVVVVAVVVELLVTDGIGALRSAVLRVPIIA